MSRLIGRANELKMLKTANQSNKAELGIVYGRRRVGKSTLLKAVKSENSLFLEGVKGLTKEKQIRHFLNQIAEQTNTIPTLAKNWSEALQVLTQFISKGRWYVVLDEVPWMASGHQEFISYLKYYWDNKWKQNNKLHDTAFIRIVFQILNYVLVDFHYIWFCQNNGLQTRIPSSHIIDSKLKAIGPVTFQMLIKYLEIRDR
jgi:AAA+ ATPase superfamily predicted ATPase